MDKVLIDTDVILDFFFDRYPFSENAAQIFSLCESNKIKGFITPVICSNAYYLLRQTARHEKVIEKLSQLMTIMDVLSMDRDIIIQALGSGFKDFEDALQNFAAIKSGFIDVILTRNVKDFVKSDIGVLTPESYLKSMSASH
ncbi:MAG: PIN domain-containing protein [Bacteroidales bacterium]|nr:PIN domain-containing protein [Bacteroidales bacterium]